MANIVLAVLTGLLVAITGYYAWQTQRMVDEMRQARGAEVLPRLVPSLALIPGGNAVLRIGNVGRGPALRVEVEFGLEPGGEMRKWTNPVVLPGETHEFDPDPTDRRISGLLNLDEMTGRYQFFRVSGRAWDAMGQEHSVDERLDIREFWVTLKAATGIAPPNYPKAVADHLDSIDEQVTALVREVKAALRRKPEPGSG